MKLDFDFKIKCPEDYDYNQLWKEFISWLNKEYNGDRYGNAAHAYYGPYKGEASSDIKDSRIEEISLEKWKSLIDIPQGESFQIECPEDHYKNDLWKEYVKYINKKYGASWQGNGVGNYYGVSDNKVFDICDPKPGVKVLSLEKWKELIITKTPVPSTKFKAGDTVKIIKNSNNHCFPIGSIVTIGKFLEDKGNYELYRISYNGTTNGVRDYDMELFTLISTPISGDLTGTIDTGAESYATADRVAQLEKTLYTNKQTMSTYSKLKMESFFADENNVKAIDEMKETLSNFHKTFNVASDNIQNMEYKAQKLANQFEAAVASDDFEKVEQLLRDNEPLVEFMVTYSKNTVQSLGQPAPEPKDPLKFFE